LKQGEIAGGRGPGLKGILRAFRLGAKNGKGWVGKENLGSGHTGWEIVRGSCPFFSLLALRGKKVFLVKLEKRLWGLRMIKRILSVF